MGNKWKIHIATEQENKKLPLLEANGLCECYSKEIYINEDTTNGQDERCYDKLELYKRKVIVHELYHALFHECGMTDYCGDELLVELLAQKHFDMVKIVKSTLDKIERE